MPALEEASSQPSGPVHTGSDTRGIAVLVRSVSHQMRRELHSWISGVTLSVDENNRSNTSSVKPSVHGRPDVPCPV